MGRNRPTNSLWFGRRSRGDISLSSRDGLGVFVNVIVLSDMDSSFRSKRGETSYGHVRRSGIIASRSNNLAGIRSNRFSSVILHGTVAQEGSRKEADGRDHSDICADRKRRTKGM